MELTLIQLLSSVSLPVSKNDTIYLDDANEVEVSRRRQSGLWEQTPVQESICTYPARRRQLQSGYGIERRRNWRQWLWKRVWIFIPNWW